MRHPKLLMFACVGLLSVSANAEEIKCPSVSAKTHYHSSSTASATESNGDCTVSVDNADADSMGFPEATIWCLGRGFRDGSLDLQVQSGNISPRQIGQVVALIAATSVPSGDGAGSIGQGARWPMSFNECDNFLGSLGSLDDNALDTGVFSQVDDGFGDSVLRCIQTGSSSFGIDSCALGQSTAQIGFTTGFGTHIVAIPR